MIASEFGGDLLKSKWMQQPVFYENAIKMQFKIYYMSIIKVYSIGEKGTW